MRHHHADHAARVRDGEHVLQEREVAPRLRRDRAVAVEAVMRVVRGEVAPPLLEAERGIGDHPVVGEQPAALVPQLRLRDHVAALVAGRAQAVQQQVQLADGERAEVALLPVQHEVARVATLLGDVLRGVDQHAGRPGGRVADAHPLGRLEQLDDQPHDRARRVELAALLAGVVGKLADQVLVGVAEDVHRALSAVRRQVRVAQVEFAEVPQQAADDAVAAERVAELRLVVPVGVAQHAVEPGLRSPPRSRRSRGSRPRRGSSTRGRSPPSAPRAARRTRARPGRAPRHCGSGHRRRRARPPRRSGRRAASGRASRRCSSCSRSSRSARAGCRPRPTAWTRAPSC